MMKTGRNGPFHRTFAHKFQVTISGFRASLRDPGMTALRKCFSEMPQTVAQNSVLVR